MSEKKLKETTGYDIAGLTVDLMSKLRSEVISVEEFKNFLTMKTEDRRNYFGVSNKEHSKIIKLKHQDFLTSELVGEFDLQKHFTGNKEINYHLSSIFEKYVLSGVETVKDLRSMEFSRYRFSGDTYDSEIAEFLNISESSGLLSAQEILWIIVSLTSHQPKCEEGILPNDGYSTIIGYLLCSDSVIRAVRIYWKAGCTGWSCDCGYNNSWFKGDILFSRKHH